MAGPRVEKVDEAPEPKTVRISSGEHYDVHDESLLPFQHIRHLGTSRWATVDQVKDIQTGAVYARKSRVKIPPNFIGSVREMYHRELRVIRHLGQHHHIIWAVASYNTKDSVALLIQPVAEGGDLKNFLLRISSEKDQKFKTRMGAVIHRAYGCLANGLSFMHEQGVRHRDIKPENILIHADSVLYTDFGIARDYSGKDSTATEGRVDFLTRKYCAPEVSDFGKRTRKTDIFSLGAVFFEMYSVLFPNESLEQIAKGRYAEQLSEIQAVLKLCKGNKEVVQCMKAMFEFEQQNRPSASQIVETLRLSDNKYFCTQCQEKMSKRNQITEASTS